jgi:hypothetical protein
MNTGHTVQAMCTPFTSSLLDPPTAFRCHPLLFIASPTSRTFTAGSLEALKKWNIKGSVDQVQNRIKSYKAMQDAGGDPMMYNGGTESIIALPIFRVQVTIERQDSRYPL